MAGLREGAIGCGVTTGDVLRIPAKVADGRGKRSEDSTSEPLQTITALVSGSKGSVFLLRVVLQEA